MPETVGMSDSCKIPARAEVPATTLKPAPIGMMAGLPGTGTPATASMQPIVSSTAMILAAVGTHSNVRKLTTEPVIEGSQQQQRCQQCTSNRQECQLQLEYQKKQECQQQHCINFKQHILST